MLDAPAATITVQFAVGSEVQLWVNGIAVDASLIGRTETDATNNLVTQTWYGVSLGPGENILKAQATEGGTAGQPVTVSVRVRGLADRISVETLESRIPADGRSTATVRGKLLDTQGNQANQDTIVTLNTSAGTFIGVDYDKDQPGFQVQTQQGQFTATLQSGLEAKIVRIRASAGTLEAYSRLEFVTALRPSLLTGVLDFRYGGRGNNFFGSFRDFLPANGDNSSQLDVNSAVFATGSIGGWLFTGAYNSNGTINQDCSGRTGLSQDVPACATYSTYGDSSTSQRIARSEDSVYLRFERNQDYFMWGDYNTDEFSTRSQYFTATSRQLHGFKANYNFGNLQITAFYGDDVQGFQRDTIAPDGTSGFYFLSQRLVLPGSESVSLELQEFDRPGTVVQRTQLTRGLDYDIDYDRGTVLFKRPILRTDLSDTGTVLVRQIVVTYQFDSQGSTTSIYAGRVRYHLSRDLNNESWIGATYVQENQGVRTFELYGADTLISLGPRGTLIAEYAHSSNTSEYLGPVSGSAFRFEFDGSINDNIKIQAYYRTADPGFANNATISFVPGQTRYGTQVIAQVGSRTNLRFQFDQENNFGIAPQPLFNDQDLFNPGQEAVPGSQVDNSLTTFSVGVQQRIGTASIELDYINRDRVDRISQDLSGNSSQLRTRITVPITRKISFQAQNELNLSADQDLVYPNRTILALDWLAYPGIKLRLSQQFISGGQFGSNSFTNLEVISDYKLGPDTTLTSRYTILGGVNGITSQRMLGLNQRWKLAPGLTLDVAYERVASDIYSLTGAGQQFAQPYAVGQSSSGLGIEGGESYSIGLEYTDNPNFKASARLQRWAQGGGGNTVITAGVAGKITNNLTMLMQYQQASAANQQLNGLGSTIDLKLGLAYRPLNNDKFNALLRYEFRVNPSSIPATILLGSGTGNNDQTLAVEMIYAPNWRWELYGKLALRSSTSYLASDFTNSSAITLSQFRVTYRLNRSIDLVAEARSINQPSANYSETGLVVEAGYYLTANLRLAVGYGFGNANDRDFSGNRSVGGFYVGFTVKLDQLFEGFRLLDKMRPRRQNASPVAKPLPASGTAATATSTQTPTSPIGQPIAPPQGSPTPAAIAPATSTTVPTATQDQPIPASTQPQPAVVAPGVAPAPESSETSTPSQVQPVSSEMPRFAHE
ncbi:TonB-dependent receptor [Neosynechococcus sphagnicola]|uniref:TonB-dependent receptor n=1 Tax=Neosynechococcus sphagnicola TaxID=1501145 RepID=UPI00138E2C43|nr:TonB-dependent receptor [Neosynechococcus sphagnicola]